MNTKKGVAGFTIVELVVVIVVIAILAAVTVTAYTGVQQRAKNAAVMTQVNQWSKILSMYKIETGKYPLSSYSCLGNSIDNFPATSAMPLGCCQEIGTNYSDYSESYLGSDMKTALSKMINPLPSGLGQEIDGVFGGTRVKSRGVLFEGAWLRYYLIGKDTDCTPGVRYTNAGSSAGDTLTGCRLELK